MRINVNANIRRSWHRQLPSGGVLSAQRIVLITLGNIVLVGEHAYRPCAALNENPAVWRTSLLF